jgi:transcriptional regulator with GAF, ATPase, and Fis domain
MACAPEIMSGATDGLEKADVNHPPPFENAKAKKTGDPAVLLDAGINAVLAETGALLGVSRAYVMLDEYGGRYLRNTHEWVDGKIGAAMFSWPLHNYEKDLPSLKPLMEGKEFFAAHTSELPPDMRRVLTMQGVDSVLLVPLRQGETWIGLMGLDSCGVRRAWQEEEIVILKYLSLLAGLYFERREYAGASHTIAAIRDILGVGSLFALPAPYISPASSESPHGGARGPEVPDDAVSLEEAERRLIIETLNRYKGNKSKAAKHLGLKWSSLDRRCKKLGMED